MSLRLEATTTSFRRGRSSSMVVLRASNRSCNSRSVSRRLRKLFWSATILSPGKFGIEVLGDRFGAGEAVVECKTRRTDQETLGDDAGIISGCESAARLLDHGLLLGLERDDLCQA